MPFSCSCSRSLPSRLGIFGEAFHQDLARAVEGGLDVGDRILGTVGGDVLGGFVLGLQGRIVEQRVGQRFEAGLLGDLRLGAALLLVGQVEVFEALLGFGILEFEQQGRRHLALFFDAGDHGEAAFFEFAQIAEAFFQKAQLRVVEAAGDFLAVAGDEGHGGAFVQQLDGGNDLGTGLAPMSAAMRCSMGGSIYTFRNSESRTLPEGGRPGKT